MTVKQNDAKKDYLSGMKYKDIASKYHVSINTVKSWKTRYHWIRGAPVEKSVHTKKKKYAHKAKKVASQNDLDISAKEELFCQLVGSQRLPLYRSYQIAFNPRGSSVNNLMTLGSRMAKRQDIHERIVQIQQNVAQKFKWSTDRVVGSLTFIHDEAKASIMKNGLNKSNSDAMLKALDQITDILNLRELDKAQIRKANADAMISEAKAKAVKQVNEDDTDQAIIIDDMTEVNEDDNSDNQETKG